MIRNVTLKKAVAKVYSTPTPSRFTVEAKVTSPSDPTYTYTPLYIEHYSILQNFHDNITDDVTIRFPIATKDLAVLHDHMDDLEVHVKLTYMAINANVLVHDPPPVFKTYKALLKNAQDVRRNLRDVEARFEIDQEIELSLIDPEFYDIRQRKTYGVFKSVQMEGLIRHIASVFKVKQLYLVPPDNRHTYEHVTIPPALGISEVFDYLQSMYGVYTKGLAAYFMEGCLYIYPPYEHEPVFPETLQIYQGDEGEYAGSSWHHRVTEQVTEIVIAGRPKVIDMTTKASENIGTDVMVLRSSHLIDGFSKTTGSGTKFEDSAPYKVGHKDAKTATPNRRNITHTSATDNVYKHMSLLAQYQAEVIAGTWVSPLPYHLKPGHAVKYSFDDRGVLSSNTGVLEGVSYVFNRGVQSQSGKFTFLSLANIAFRTTPEDDRLKIGEDGA